MATNGQRPLWLAIEDKILEHAGQDFSAGGQEALVQKIAGELDLKGGGQWIHLRKAVQERLDTGKVLMQHFNASLSALTLDDVGDTYQAMMSMTCSLGETWPRMKESKYRPDVQAVIEAQKLDLQIARANELGGQAGIRFMIEQGVAKGVVIESLGIDEGQYKEVAAIIAAEKAEIARVKELIAGVAGKSADDQIKKLIDSNVADELILKVGGFDQATLDKVKADLEAELAEKKRKEEEEAARKKAEAEGPALDAIPADEMLEHIEAVREILDFSDKENEIRTMCQQSSIPKALVDIAISEPAKLDELEEQAENA